MLNPDFSGQKTPLPLTKSVIKLLKIIMKHYLYTLLILVLFSCDKEEPEKPNTSPKAFEVTAKVEGTDVTLTWTEAVDSDGDAVTYAIVYGDTLAKGLTARTFTIKNLPYETEIAGTVMASDGKGGETESRFKVKTGENPFVKISDEEFEKFLIKEGIDDVLDGKVLKENVIKVKILRFASAKGEWGRIDSFTGIEHFLNLEELLIAGNSLLQDIDFSKNKKLKILALENCLNLRKVNLKNNSELEYLYLVETDLRDVDLSGNKKLKGLSLIWNVEDGKGYSFMKDINLTENAELVSAYFSGIGLERMDLTNNTRLAFLACDNNNLSHLDLSNNTRLEILYCNHNYLTELNLCYNSNLKQ
jgi:hypothetical protein